MPKRWMKCNRSDVVISLYLFHGWSCCSQLSILAPIVPSHSDEKCFISLVYRNCNGNKFLLLSESA